MVEVLDPAGQRTGQPASERQGVPALEKGLDLLEALAAESGSVSQKQLAARVGRSAAEVFRALGVLERRGYVARETEHGHYHLTLKLFELAHRHHATRRLQAAAQPIMQSLAERLGHACHLIVLTRGHMLVVAQAEPHGALVLAIRPGATFPFAAAYTSARIIAAFDPEPRRSEHIGTLLAQPDAPEEAALRAELDLIARRGYGCNASVMAPSVTHIACPVFDHLGRVGASLAVPLLTGEQEDNRERLPRRVAPLLAAAARQISAAIGAPRPARG